MGRLSSISLVISLLIISSVLICGGAKAQSGTDTISAGKVLSWPMSFPSGGEISYDIRVVSGGNVDVYLIPEEDMEDLLAGRSFTYLGAGSVEDTSHAVRSVNLPSGEYRLAIVNDGWLPVTVAYDVSGASLSGALVGGLVVVVVLVLIVVGVLAHVSKRRTFVQVAPPVRGSFCRHCGRAIPPDAVVCPYCAQSVR